MHAPSEQAPASTFAPGPGEARPRPARARRPPAARAALAHGAYLLGTGAWPLVSLRSFAAVTGPRPEGWLTRGLGACLANIGAALIAAGLRGKVSRELRLLGAGTALAFAGMDVHHALSRRRVAPAYLLNAAAQLAFAGLWGAAALREAREAARPPEAAFA